MGACLSTGDENYDGYVSSSENAETNVQLRKMNREGNQCRLLLYGTGEAGKSTFFRQLKLIALRISTLVSVEPHKRHIFGDR